MSRQVKASVIVTNYNGGELVLRCLASMRSQTFRDFETIVVDNASVDGSAECIARQFPEVECIRLDENLGFAGGTNRGIARARGEYIALLNNDAIAQSDWLAELVSVLDNEQEYAFCASRIRRLDRPDLIDRAGDVFTIAAVPCMRGYLHPEAGRFTEPGEVFGASAAAAIYRASMLEDIGLFDEDFFCLHEDVDLAIRARLAGYRCRYVPTAQVLHRGAGSLNSLGPRTTYLGQRNLEFVLMKNLPLDIMIRHFHQHMLFNAFAFLYTLSRGEGLAFLQAKVHALTRLGPMLRKRRSLRSKRRITSAEFESYLERNWFSLKWDQMLRETKLRRESAETT